MGFVSLTSSISSYLPYGCADMFIAVQTVCPGRKVSVDTEWSRPLVLEMHGHRHGNRVFSYLD